MFILQKTNRGWLLEIELLLLKALESIYNDANLIRLSSPHGHIIE